MKQGQIIKWSLYAVGTIIIVLLLVEASRWIKRFFGNEAPALGYSEDRPVEQPGGDPAIGTGSFDEQSGTCDLPPELTDMVLDLNAYLTDSFYWLGLGSSVVFEDLMELTDQGFIAVINCYNGSMERTFRRDMNDLSSWTYFSTTASKSKILERMDKLDLI